MNPVLNSPTPAETQQYSLLGYKRLILDYHYSNFAPNTLTNARADEIIEAAVGLGLDSFLLYAKDQWGHVYYKTDDFKAHPNAPEDLFGQVLAGLSRSNIQTIAYFTICWDELAANEHPEWRVVSRDGRDVRDGSYYDSATHAKWAFLCLNTGYRDYVLAQLRELISNYTFAALFLDIMLLWRGVNECYCPTCKRLWQEQCGAPLPQEFSPAIASQYRKFMINSLREFHQEVRDLIAKEGKNILTTHNFGTYYDLDDYVAMEIDAYGRDFFRSSRLAKLYRARAGGREVELIGHRHNGEWDYMVKSVPMLQWESATAIAHNCAIMYVDQPHIQGDLDPVVYRRLRQAYQTAEELAPHATGTRPYAEILVLESEHSAFIAPKEAQDLIGAHKILTELHLPFDMVSDFRLTREQLDRTSTLIVPCSEYLDDSTCAMISDWVEDGGNLLFGYRTAFGDEDGGVRRKPGFGLIETLGASDHKIDFMLPTFFEEVERIKLRGFERFKTPGGAEILATYTPPCFEVTEREWVAHQPSPGPDSDEPAAVLARHGQGAFIYLGCRLFRDYLIQEHGSVRRFVEYCLQRLAKPRVSVHAPRMVEAVFAENDDSLKVFLINGITGKPCGQLPSAASKTPYLMHVNIDDIVPVHDIRVEIVGRPVRSARSFDGVPLTVVGSTVTLPELGLYGGITITYA